MVGKADPSHSPVRARATASTRTFAGLPDGLEDRGSPRHLGAARSIVLVPHRPPGPERRAGAAVDGHVPRPLPLDRLGYLATPGADPPAGGALAPPPLWRKL